MSRQAEDASRNGSINNLSLNGNKAGGLGDTRAVYRSFCRDCLLGIGGLKAHPTTEVSREPSPALLLGDGVGDRVGAEHPTLPKRDTGYGGTPVRPSNMMHRRNNNL
jgi:hypothetical protein